MEIVEWNTYDARNPYSWPEEKKVLLTAIALCATFIMMLNGTIITVAHGAIGEQFHVSDASFPNSYWLVMSWAAGGALISFIVLPVIDDFGIHSLFLGGYLVFLYFLNPQAPAYNYSTLVVSRFFSGGCVAVIAKSTSSFISNT